MWIKQTLEETYGDPAKLSPSELKEYKVAVQKEKNKKKNIEKSEKELIKVLTENHKSGQQIDEVLALFDPQGKYMAIEGLAGRAQYKGDTRSEKAKVILDKLRDLNDSSMPIDKSKKQIENDKAAEEYDKSVDDTNAVAKEVEELEELAKGIDPEGYKSVKEQLDEVDATFKTTLDNDDVRAIFRRIMKCPEGL